MREECFICTTCGTQYAASETPPATCPICTDERQYVNPVGQQWTTLDALRSGHSNRFTSTGPGVTGIATTPAFGIGQRACLIETPHGNVLWDCIAFLDAATIEEVQRRGGLAAIAISHPHFYTTMVAWSHACGDVPIWLHSANRRWVMRPDPAVRFWEGETHELLPGVTVIRCGGHFTGSTALHWREADAGAGALFTGDTIKIARDTRYVSFMYSYPNLIPLDANSVRRIATAVEPYAFDRLYDGWDVIAHDAKTAVNQSAVRYSAFLHGPAASAE